MLYVAEQAKITLSATTSAEMIIDGFDDDEGATVDAEILITRAEFNDLIKLSVDRTIDMVKVILTRNDLTPKDVSFNLMVGGSTYIPYIRERVGQVLGIPVNSEIDPTTAVAIGAAHYAASKEIDLSGNGNEKPFDETKVVLKIKASYAKASKEQEEFFAAKVFGITEGLEYRITRDDGGFDSGRRELKQLINVDLPLVDNAYNYFTFIVTDGLNNPVGHNLGKIGINSGYAISGQPQPEDICLEVDDLDNPGETRLELLFARNSILPNSATKTYPLNRTLIKGDDSQPILINVVQGPQNALPAANKTIGFINITGKNLNRDVAKGSDIEITVNMSESQDLTVSAYFTMVDQTFKDTFNPKARHTPVRVLKDSIVDLKTKLDEEIEEANEVEDYETAGELTRLRKEMEPVVIASDNMIDDDVTDTRYQLEDKKRRIAQQIDAATKGKRIQNAIAQYQTVKEDCRSLLGASGNDNEWATFKNIELQEAAFLSTNSPAKIQERTDILSGIMGKIRWRLPEFLTSVFEYLQSQQSSMNDQTQAKSQMDAGRLALDSQNWDRLREVNFGLFGLIPNARKEDFTKGKIGF